MQCKCNIYSSYDVVRCIIDITILYKLNLSFRNQRVKIDVSFKYRTEK